MKKQITFAKLKKKSTPKIIEKLKKLYNCNCCLTDESCYDCEVFPLLLHRTVEEWNNNSNGYLRFIHRDKDYLSIFITETKKIYFTYNDYKRCHLTICEMAILDCFIKILKEN